jgi:hypothetical protein
MAETSQDIRHGQQFLNRGPIAQEIITRIDKWNCIKLKTFCTGKKTIIRGRDSLQKIFASFI